MIELTAMGLEIALPPDVHLQFPTVHWKRFIKFTVKLHVRKALGLPPIISRHLQRCRVWHKVPVDTRGAVTSILVTADIVVL